MDEQNTRGSRVPSSVHFDCQKYPYVTVRHAHERERGEDNTYGWTWVVGDAITVDRGTVNPPV